MKRTLTLLTLAAITAVAAATAARPANALILTGAKWPNGIVPVCFRAGATGTSFPGFATMAPLTRDTVNEGLARYANLQFVGWGVCPSTSPAGTLEIRFANGDAFVENPLGYRSGSPTRMTLDASETGNRFASMVLHEFGHALGFEHEMDRRDNPNVKPADCWGTDAGGDLLGTPFDPRSIMAWSYCPTRGDSGPISAWDVIGVQNAYGRKAPGSLVGTNNYCLDVPGSSWALKIELQVYTCNGTSAQRWAHLYGTLQAKPSGIARCADVPGDTVASGGTVLVSNTCYGGSPGAPGQLFTFSNVEIRGLGELCLDVPGSSYTAGYVQLYDCNGTAAQRWTVEKDGTVRSGSSGYCLDVPYNAPKAGLSLWMWPCIGTAAQKFTFTAGGEIRFAGYCLDSVGATPTNGSRIRLMYCKTDDRSRRNQQWHLRGSVRGVGAACLQVRGGVPFDGAKAQLGSCGLSALTGSVAPTRTWDYWF